MKTSISEIQGLKCVIRMPDDHTPEKKHPLILFLHGAGTRGTDIQPLEQHLFFKITAQHEAFPFVTVAPLCTENTWFDLFDPLKRLVAELATYDFVDPARIYLMGASMGGYTAWQLAMSIPDMFAAMVPICGGGMYWNAARLVNLPIWAFHGALDQTVLPEESVKMVNAVNKKNGNAKLTLYPNNRHDAWTDTFSNPAVFAWLLKHKKSTGADLTDDYHGSTLYG